MKAIVILLSLVTASAWSQSRHTESELQAMTKSELVNLVLRLEDRIYGPRPNGCDTFELTDTNSGSLLVRVRNPGYTNDGTLKWPNGNVFLVRNSGYTNDRTLKWPDDTTMLVRNQGYTNDKTIKWPNSNNLLLRNEGYTNDRSIFRADGSNWLIRNAGYSNDRQRVGLPMERATYRDYSVEARLTPDDSVNVETTLSGDNWTLKVVLDGTTNKVRITECL